MLFANFSPRAQKVLGVSTFGVLVVLAVIVATLGYSYTASYAPVSASPDTSAPVSNYPTFTASERAYLNDLHQAMDFSSNVDVEAYMVTLAHSVCSDLRTRSEATMRSDIMAAGYSLNAAYWQVYYAERHLC